MQFITLLLTVAFVFRPQVSRCAPLTADTHVASTRSTTQLVSLLLNPPICSCVTFSNRLRNTITPTLAMTQLDITQPPESRNKNTSVEVQRYLRLVTQSPNGPSTCPSYAVRPVQSRSCSRQQSSTPKRSKMCTSPCNTLAPTPSAALPLFPALRFLPVHSTHTSRLPSHLFKDPPHRPGTLAAMFMISKSPPDGVLSTTQVSKALVFGHIDRL